MTIDAQGAESARIYLDVTSTLVTRNITGIPRVVRNLAGHITTSKIVLVEYDGLADAYFEVDQNLMSSQYDTATQVEKSSSFIRIYKQFGEIRLVSKIITRILRNRYAFYLLRAIIGPKTATTGKKVSIQNGVLFIPEVPLNQAHVRHIERMSGQPNIKLAILLHDLLPLQYPQYFSDDLVWKFRNFSALLQLSDLTIVTSQSMKQQFLELLPEKRVEIVPLPSSFTQYNGEIRRDNFFLMVGTIEPRKNHITVLKAFEKFSTRDPSARLTIVGARGWKYRKILQELKRLQKNGLHIEWYESVSDNRLLEFYRSARALIFPSFCEGYGLPILEALSQRTPVITSDVAVLRDFARYGGVELVNPIDVEGFVAKMQTLQDSKYAQSLSANIRVDDIPIGWNCTAQTIFSHLNSLLQP
ncbi:MAG: mannosyltransferase [Actinomycetota bacterium]|jgi:glycosyltransferase involved in cell wall biosynthesis